MLDAHQYPIVALCIRLDLKFQEVFPEVINLYLPQIRWSPTSLDQVCFLKLLFFKTPVSHLRPLNSSESRVQARWQSISVCQALMI